LIAQHLGLLDEALGVDPRLFCLALALCLGRNDLGLLLGLAQGDLLLLHQGRKALVLFDVELELGGLEIFLGDRDLGVLLDLVAFLGAALRRFGQPRQALGVEGVVGIEKLLLRLVEARQRHALQLEPVLHQILGDRVLHALDEILPLVAQLLHRHRHRGGPQRVDELVFNQLLQRLRIERARAQGLCRVGDALDGRDAAHKEGHDDIYAHAVLGEQAVRPRAMHLELQRVHVDPDQLVKHRQADNTTVHHDLLTAQSGAHKRPVL